MIKPNQTKSNQRNASQSSGRWECEAEKERATANLDRILRYETALERQLCRTMNQRQRLQRRRLGEAAPARLAVDLSARFLPVRTAQRTHPKQRASAGATVGMSLHRARLRARERSHFRGDSLRGHSAPACLRP